jgi:uncharacterized protein (DUF302 family)
MAEGARQATFHFSRLLRAPFGEAMERVITALKKEGFRVLAYIDVREILRETLGVDFHKYCILGAFNAPLAHRALQLEDKIGAMLPYNVVVQQRADDTVEVSAVDPVASIQAIGNPELEEIARAAGARLKSVIEAI